MSDTPATTTAAELGDFTIEIADQVRSFTLSIREIAAGEDPSHAISLLLLQVSQLLLAGGRLGAIQDVLPEGEYEPDLGGEPDVDGLRTALANALEPVDEYVEVFDPYDAEPEIVPSRLSDDLADVTASLLHGLAHYDSGRHSEALWWWQFSYLNSWGGTASSALRALHSVVAHVRLDADEVDDDAAVEERLLADTAARAVEDRA